MDCFPPCLWANWRQPCQRDPLNRWLRRFSFSLDGHIGPRCQPLAPTIEPRVGNIQSFLVPRLRSTTLLKCRCPIKICNQIRPTCMNHIRWMWLMLQVLHSDAPKLWLLPTEMSKKRVHVCYMCPLYRTTERRGVLATTGHSSNFVFNVEMPTAIDPDHWTRRGVAMLLSLSD